MKSASLWKCSVGIVISVLLLGPLALHAQNDSIEYCPITIEDATWVIYDNSGFYSPVGFANSYVVRIEGDSLFNDILYKKMWVANWMHDDDLHPSEVMPPYIIDSLRFYGLVRDDVENRRFVGIVPLYEDVNNEQEVLIHDFGIAVGEDILGAYKFDTVTLQDIVVDTFYGKIRLAQIPPRREILTIEGIGTVNTGPLCQNPVLALNEGHRSLIDYCIGSMEECGIQFSTTSTSEAFARGAVAEEEVLSPSSDFVELFPNPASDFINLRIEQSSWLVNGGDYQIISRSGRIYAQGTFTGHDQQIPISELPNGLYFIKLEVNGRILASVRFVKAS